MGINLITQFLKMLTNLWHKKNYCQFENTEFTENTKDNIDFQVKNGFGFIEGWNEGRLFETGEESLSPAKPDSLLLDYAKKKKNIK
jgi:hypothetical protein